MNASSDDDCFSPYGDHDTPQGQSALFKAAEEGDLVKILDALPFGTPNSFDPECQRTALMHAVFMGNLEAVEMLIQHDNPNEADPQGITALMEAASQGFTNIVKLLIEHCDVNAVSNSGHTALMMAVIWEQLECVKVLAECSDLEVKNKDGLTAYVLAFHGGMAECADEISMAKVRKEKRLLVAETRDSVVPEVAKPKRL